MLFTCFRCFVVETWTWKHDRRRGHHWATSDICEFIKKNSLHYYLPNYLHSEPRNLKSDIWQSFSVVKCLFRETERKTEHPSCLSCGLSRAGDAHKVIDGAGAGLKTIIAERDRILRERGDIGLKILPSADLYRERLNRNRSGHIYKANSSLVFLNRTMKSGRKRVGEPYGV